MGFRLGGQDYDLTKEDVEDHLKHAAPEDVRKHYVVIDCRRYPVKQALSIAIGRPVTDFITTDATRIFSNLGFEVGNIKGSTPQIKNTSEILFEEYLQSKGFGYFQFQKMMPGTLKKPDYSLNFGGQEILFEVKELTATDDDFKPGAYDPYEPIREKINSAGRQFRDLKQYCCCLVLFDKGKPGLDLSWRSIYSAMLGTPAIRVPFNRAMGEFDYKSAYSDLNPVHAKMVRSKGGEPIAPQNTTITAIAILEQMQIGRRRFNVEVGLQKRDRRDTLEIEEFWRLVQEARGTERDVSLRQLRVVLCENPYRRIPFPHEVFQGPYDEVYGPDEATKDRIIRLYAGEQIKKLESQEEPVKSPIQEIIEESTRNRETRSEDR